LNPGTDIPLLNIVLTKILEHHEDHPEDGWIDEEFIAERTEGFDHLKETLEDFDTEAAAEECGVPLEAIELAAEKYAEADNAAIFTGMGMSQHACGVDNVQNEINLALITGNLGRPGTGVNPLRGQNNVQGTCDVGTMPNVLPGYQLVDDDEARESVEEVWGFEIPAEPGLTNVEISYEAGDSIKGLYVMGENPVMSEPDATNVADRLEDLEFTVVQDIFPTETAEYADVILPATTWAERGGTVTNTDRRVQRMRGVEKVHENTKHDREIVSEIGTRLFDSGFDFEDPEEIFEELRQVCPSYHGMTYDLLGEEGLHWPCYEPGDEGDPFLYEHEFDTESGLGRIEGVAHQPPAETPDDEYPLILTTARLEEHYNTGTMSTRSPTLNKQTPENFVDVHPADAERYGIEDGEYVRLHSRRGEITLEAHVTEDTKEGVVWTTPHFAAASANKLTNHVLDERSKIPEYKAAAAEIDVDIEPLGEKPRIRRPGTTETAVLRGSVSGGGRRVVRDRHPGQLEPRVGARLGDDDLDQRPITRLAGGSNPDTGPPTAVLEAFGRRRHPTVTGRTAVSKHSQSRQEVATLVDRERVPSLESGSEFGRRSHVRRERRGRLPSDLCSTVENVRRVAELPDFVRAEHRPHVVRTRFGSAVAR